MSLLTSAPISQLAVELLRRTLVLPATVARVPAPEYSGPSGGTVTLRVPQPRTANKQATPGSLITYSDLDEVAVDVSVNHWYDATRVTDEDLSMALQDFGSQILLPQVAAVAEAAEDELAGVMNGLTLDASIQWANAANPDADTATVLAAIREQLSTDQVPAGNRFVAVAPDVATRLLSVPTFVKADERGSTTGSRGGDHRPDLRADVRGVLSARRRDRDRLPRERLRLRLDAAGLASGWRRQLDGRWRGREPAPHPGVRSDEARHGIRRQRVRRRRRGPRERRGDRGQARSPDRNRRLMKHLVCRAGWEVSPFPPTSSVRRLGRLRNHDQGGGVSRANLQDGAVSAPDSAYAPLRFPTGTR